MAIPPWVVLRLRVGSDSLANGSAAGLSTAQHNDMGRPRETASSTTIVIIVDCRFGQPLADLVDGVALFKIRLVVMSL
jgi:hypothetical protein